MYVLLFLDFFTKFNFKLIFKFLSKINFTGEKFFNPFSLQSNFGLSELAVTWDFSDQVTSAIPGLSSAKLSLIGRNLLTITDYSGWDPEVTNYSSGVQQYFSVDYGVYPTQSTYSLSLKLNF